MKKLPPLSLDLRRDTLAKGGDFVNVIAGETVIARINSIAGDYGHAGEIVDRLNGWEPMVKALRALAIVHTMKPGIQAVVHDGHRCRVCASTWDMKKPEKHQDWCALKGTEA